MSSMPSREVWVRAGLGALAALGTGCLEADLVTCSDGRACPGGTVCDVERATCIDPRLRERRAA